MFGNNPKGPKCAEHRVLFNTSRHNTQNLVVARSRHGS